MNRASPSTGSMAAMRGCSGVVVVLVPLLTAGCPSPSSEPGSCAEVLHPGRVAGCFDGPVVGGDSGTWAPVSGDWEGVVAEVGLGAFPAACARPVADSGLGSGWWVRVATDGGDVWAGVETPGSTAPAVGDTVRVRGGWSQAAFGPTVAAVEVSSGGVILGYVGEGGALGDLAPLGVYLDLGEPACLEQDDCGDWRGYGLEVTVGAGEAQGVPYGTTGAVGTFQVTNADLRAQVGAGAGCPDWYVASARIGIGR